MSALGRKSWQDIRRRRARSAFTVATIAAAVVGLSMFALPTLMDRAMIISFVLISVTVFESMLVFRYRERGNEALALQIDRASRWVFPTVYITLLIGSAAIPHIY